MRNLFWNAFLVLSLYFFTLAYFKLTFLIFKLNSLLGAESLITLLLNSNNFCHIRGKITLLNDHSISDINSALLKSKECPHLHHLQIRWLHHHCAHWISVYHIPLHLMEAL